MPIAQGALTLHLKTVIPGLIALCSLAAAFGQSPVGKPDPLHWVFMEEHPPEKKVRLRITLLRVPLWEAAEALLSDRGETPYFWRARLTEWRKADKLQEVAIFGGDVEDMEERSGPSARTFRFIGQGAAARFWQNLLATKEAGEAPPDATDLLQELSEHSYGNSFKGILSLRAGLQQALVKLDLMHCPQPEERPTTTWPLPLLKAPRYLFRPWSLHVAAACPVNEAFLLGSQMEPPHDGQVHTGHLLMAFGRILLPETAGNDLEEEPLRIEPCRQFQAWTLAVHKDVFLPWIAARQSAAADGETLAAWLKLAAEGNLVEVAGTAAVAVANFGKGEVMSTLRWQDVTGFEPSITDTEFRPIPCEEGIYSLQHGLTFSLGRAEGTSGNAWTVEMDLTQPAGPARWQKWKTAMERDATDANAIEVAEADLDEISQLLRTRLDLQAGHVTMAGAGMKNDRVQVSFVRLTETAPPKAAAAPEPVPAEAPPFKPPLTMTLWSIETPESWQQKLLGRDLDLPALAQDLMNAAKAGKEAALTGISCQVLRDDSRSYHSATEPKIFFGGNYVNTAPAPAGIFFNTRHVGQVRVGRRSGIEMVAGGSVAACSIDEIGQPEWRHWGIWQPAVKATRQTNSGIEQPIFPTCSLTLCAHPQAAPLQVIGVLRVSDPAATEPHPAKLRWQVLRCDGVANMADPALPPPLEEANISLVTVQAAVLRVPASHAIDADATRAGEGLLAEVQAGKLQVLDLAILNTYEDSPAKAATGMDFYFTNGRGRGPNEHWNDVFKAPAVMPAGTTYDDQISFRNRLVGFSLTVQGRHWKIERDGKPPEIVTDTFADVIQEWPRGRTEWKDLPRLTICVQRPIFTLQEQAGELPEPGRCSVTRLSEDTVLIMRTFK